MRLEALRRFWCRWPPSFALSSALLTALASAGTVEQATFFADPQMQVKDGAIRGCGYRLKSIPAVDGTLTVVALDVSFNLYDGGLALLKGGAVQVTIKSGSSVPPKNRPIESFWLKVQGGKPTVSLNNKVLAAETKGYLLYGVTFQSAWQLFEAVSDETPITVGVRIKGEAVDRIYTGIAQVPQQQKAEVLQCVTELAKQMQSALETKQATPGR